MRVRKDETLALAAKHVQSGKKIIMAFGRQLPIGYILRRWSASDLDSPRPEEIIDDQPLVVVREASYAEYLENRPAEFPKAVIVANLARFHFYEMTCE
jgi:hypothetical protein